MTYLKGASVLYGYSAVSQAKADGDGLVYHVHGFVIQMPHFFLEPLLVNGSDLLQQNDGALGKPVARAIGGKLTLHLNVGGNTITKNNLLQCFALSTHFKIHLCWVL